VGVQVLDDTPVTRQITNADVEVARVTLSVPALTTQDTTNGDLHGGSVQIAIDVQPFGGSFTEVNLGAAAVISGKTRNRYQRSFRIPLTGSAPWNIRVRRLTPDSAAANIQNQTWWDSYTEITPVKMTYPNSAIVGVRIDSSQFNSIPTRAYHMKLLRVRVPSNYDPDTRTYTGIWDGTFNVAWTNNPAWCYYDLVTNTRYGLGSNIPEAMTDKWSLYEIGKYCDEMVPNGFGGVEPRFVLNVYIQSREEAYRVMSDLASAFRGMVYWSTGSLFAVQDAPSDPVALFNATNVIDGEFLREGSGRKARHTAAVVQWNDPNEFYRLRPEYVEDPVGVARYGLRTTEVVAFGTTSQGQAHRVGKWILYTERYESEIVAFKTGLDAAYVRPGQIIKIVDPNRSASRYGGRVVSATSTSVTVDAPLTVGIGTHVLSLVMPDGTLVDRTLTNAAGDHTILTFTEALPDTDITQSIWVVGTPSVEPELLRVLSVAEESANSFRVVGVAHYPDKYAAIEQNLKLQLPPTSDLKLAPDPVGDLAGSEYLYKHSGAVSTRLVVSFDASPTAVSYQVSYKRQDGGNWITLPISSSTHVEVDDVVPATYDIKVVALNGLGKSSQPSTVTYTVLGKAGIPPANVTGFAATFYPQQLQLTWNEVADLDLSGYEIRDGATWGSASVLITGYAGTAYSVGAPAAGSHTYHIKAIDTSGNYSDVSAEVTVTVADRSAPAVSAGLIGDQAILTWIEALDGDFLVDYYAIRVGTDWATATPLTTTKGTSLRVPADWAGARTFLVASVDLAGNVSAAGSVELTISAPAAPVPSVSISGVNFLLSWPAPASDLPIEQYEVRHGASWAAGVSLGTIKGSTFSQKVEWVGARQFWVAAIDVKGNVGAAGGTSIEVTAPSAPTVNLQVVDNNVLLSWTDSQQTLPVEYYQVSRGTTFAGSTVIGNINGRFSTIFEKSSGSYTYWIVAVDSAGNMGTEAGQTAFVNQPPDYVLYGDDNSGLDSTSVENALFVNYQNYALTLDDTGAQYGRVASMPALDSGVTGLTFESWFMPEALSGNYGLQEKTVAGNTGTCALLFVTGTTLTMRVFVGGVAKDATVDLATLGFGDRAAIYAVGRWSSADGVSVSVQGVNYTPVAAAGSLDQGAGEFSVGRLGTGATSYALEGKLGPQRVSTRRISDAEVTKRYRDIITDRTGLVASWNFSEGAGDAAADDTDNSYNLQLLSAPTFTLTELDGRYDNSPLSSYLMYPVATEKTYDELFNAGGRTTPQANITAGYTRYCHPNEATGQYVEVIDYGAVLPSSLITVTLTSAALDGTVTVTPTLSVKELEGDPWTDFAGVWSVYGTQFQFLKVTLDITATAGANVTKATSCNFRLDVKIKNDGGTAVCDSADVGGTVVSFNVAFVDVSSITVTPLGTTPITPTYDFVDAPNPTDFKILLFNPATGARVSGTASWQAKGS
jgi:hypothetical protein